MKAKSFCIPVLGHMNDVLGEFKPQLKVDTKKGETFLYLSNLETCNETIDDLIQKNIAKFVVKVSCLKTMLSYTHDLKLENKMSQISLQSSRLREKVIVEIFVCAENRISLYKPKGMAGYFQGTKFSVEAGEIMVVGPEFSFLADKEFNPLKPRLNSFVRIRCGIDDSGPAQFYLDSDFLEIHLSKKDWTSYSRMKAFPPSVLHSILVLPLLTEAIREVLSEDTSSEFQELRWYGRLEKMLEVKGLKKSSEDPSYIAQIILNNCITRSFDDLIADNETENA